MQLSLADSGRNGKFVIAVRVGDANDHCPVLVESTFARELVPALQTAPLFQIQATDYDSGDNSLISYFVSSYKMM